MQLLPSFFLKKNTDVAYWETRYKNQGNSGAGSYGKVAEFKSDYLNRLAKAEELRSAIEFGCGDGNNLALYNFPQYIGLDISSEAIRICKEKFKKDTTKSFLLYDSLRFKPINSFIKDVALSLDVLYHITNNKNAIKYCRDVFYCAKKIAVFFTNDAKRFETISTGDHIKLHDVMALFNKFPEFRLIARDPCPYHDASSAEMFVLKRIHRDHVL